MTSRLRISLSLLLVLGAQKVCAQYLPAEDFFNAGAQLYISNNVPAALERTETGLKIYPNDEKLQKLEKLLKQQQQQQNQQQQNQQNQQQQSQQDQKQQDKKDQKQQQDQKKNSDQQKQDQQKQSDQKKDEDQKKQQEQKKDSGDKPKDEKQDQQPGQPVKAGEMTPEEAKRLLDAQKGNEQLLQLKPENKPHNPLRSVKDW